MKILEIITPSRIGGAETHVASLIQGLSEMGDMITVFCPSGRPFVRYLEERGIHPITWKTYGKVDPVTVLRLSDLIRTHEIDIVHTHLSTASLLGGIAAHLAKRPQIATIHGFNTATCFRKADRIIAVSEAVKTYLLEQNIPEDKIRVIYNGIHLDNYQKIPVETARKKYKIPPGIFLVGIFGRLSSEKGQQIAVEGWKKVADICPDANLMLVGSGKNKKYLKERIQELGLENRISLRGFIPNPQDLMCACNVVLVPSLKEGFGLAAVEAMTLQRPVITSDAGGLREIITDGETGLTFPVGDPDSLAESVLKLRSDHELAESLARAGNQEVRMKFDSEIMLNKLRKSMRELCRENIIKRSH